MRRTKFAMYGYLRPNLSPRIPKMAAPTDRSMSVNVMAHVIAAGSFPNESAIFETVNETLKKSNASYGINSLSSEGEIVPMSTQGNQ